MSTILEKMDILDNFLNNLGSLCSKRNTRYKSVRDLHNLLSKEEDEQPGILETGCSYGRTLFMASMWGVKASGIEYDPVKLSIALHSGNTLDLDTSICDCADMFCRRQNIIYIFDVYYMPEHRRVSAINIKKMMDFNLLICYQRTADVFVRICSLQLLGKMDICTTDGIMHEFGIYKH